MCLINVDTLKLEEHFSKYIPKYTILSHTWGEDEVTFKNMQRPLEEIEHKRGFSKIHGCIKQTRLQSLSYCWVDTCCSIQTHHRRQFPPKRVAYAARSGDRMYTMYSLSIQTYQYFLTQSPFSSENPCFTL
jgi:hypothetical protein